MADNEAKPEPGHVLCGRDRNIIAAVLSVVPGLGHLYKHHFLFGLGLIVSTPLVLWIAVLLTLATFGFSIILVPVAFWGFVAFDAYRIADWHGKHLHLHPGGAEGGDRP